MQKMTLSDFLLWEERQPERYEFFRGETFAMVGGTARHNRVILNCLHHSNRRIKSSTDDI